MRSPKRAVGLTFALLCALVVSGCTPPDSTPTQTPTPAVTPVFASDDEALAAALAAYKKYLAVSDDVAHDGGMDPERIASVATGTALANNLSTFADFRKQKLRGTGSVQFRNFKFKSADAQSGEVGAYVCLDVSDTDVVNASGVSTVSKDRVVVFPFELTFTVPPSTATPLLSDSRAWQGGDVC